MKKVSTKATSVRKTPTKKIPKNSDTMDLSKDLVDTLEVLDSVNDRLFSTEKTVAEISKFLNVMTNTLNYCLATMFVYESYLIDLGVDRNELQKQIDSVYFESYQKKQSTDQVFNKSVLTKINKKITEFQSKLNENEPNN